ncbi:hypothetical protein EIP86_003556 [Pleurotus ostreatoroseus]|nr:hypothetical protein EIP86_003556 [Pleurotus ostreatoroseus]
MVKFLRKARQVLKEGEAYRKLVGLLEARYNKNNFRPEDIQDLCNLLYDFPGLLEEFSQLLPPENTFALSDDFDLTRVVNVLADGQILHRLATFGLMNIDARSGEYARADEYVRHLLKSCFTDRNREEALITLVGGDAQRALSQMQEVSAVFVLIGKGSSCCSSWILEIVGRHSRILCHPTIALLTAESFGNAHED